MVTPLLDCDVLVYEVGFGAETAWKGMNGEGCGPPPFDLVAEMLDGRIEDICFNVNATSPPVCFLTGKHNFREAVAVTVPYKGGRDKLHKPWHYNNIRAYLQGKYDAQVIDYMEADDALALAQTEETIICSRDKDLKQVPGWHYSWELGNSPAIGPLYATDPGEITLNDKRNKIVGSGLKFFYSQCLTGDKVDNIVGIPKCGAVKAFDLLVNISTPEEMLETVREAYRGFYGDSGDTMLLENGRLLWMTRKLTEKGEPVLWEMGMTS